MKLQPKRLLAALLAGLMILPTAACATGDDPTETQSPGATSAETEADTGYKPDIEKTNYNADFVITGVDTVLAWSVASEESVGDPFLYTIYERSIRIKDHLGVTLVATEEKDAYTYANEVIRSVQAGDDSYQLVATPCHLGVNTLISSGAMYDLAELDAINMDAPYWAAEQMEKYVVGDKYLIGYNDFCLAKASGIVFSKDLSDEYRLAYPYEDVRNMKWTLDRMTAYAANVARDNGDNVWDEKDTYGIVGGGFTDFVPFSTSCGIKMADKDADGNYHVAYSDTVERTLTMLEKVSAMRSAQYAFFSVPYTDRMDKVVSFEDGFALMKLIDTGELMGMRGASTRFGVLPYPMFDEAQGEYYSLNWNGMFMIPGSIKNESMVGEVVELLAYYTAPVKTAFYEDLLGAKLADAPEDAEMLDVIWNTQTSDICLVTADEGNRVWVDLLYLVPYMCSDGVNTYSSYLKSRKKAADKIINKLFNP